MIGPDELLTVRFPDLKENQVIVPGTTKLTFNISRAGTKNRTLVKNKNRTLVKNKNRTLVKNLGRNIIRNQNSL